MVNETKEKTALATSVGADERQSNQINSENSIPTLETEINEEIENPEEKLEEMYRRMRRMADPRYLHTVSMTELFQTPYKSRPPIIEGLLYAGAYILAGAPKIGKSFLVAQIAYHVSTGKKLWEYEAHQCIRRRETTVEPFKSDTPTAEIRHSFRWSDSWGCKRGDRLICQPPRRLT